MDVLVLLAGKSLCNDMFSGMPVIQICKRENIIWGGGGVALPRQTKIAK